LFIAEKDVETQLIDGITGYTELGVYELLTYVHVSFVELLRELVLKGIKKLEKEK